MKFCAKTTGLTEEQNEQFAKDLKDFVENKSKEFQDNNEEE